jgi:prepilin-type N-terminal cleavage/methylation domain-containing protein
MRARLRRRGYTMIEVAIAASLLVVLIMATTEVVTVVQRTAVATLTQSDAQRHARRILAQIRSELRQSGWEGSTDQVSSPAQDGVATGVLTFQTRTGLAAGAWSPSITYRLTKDSAFKSTPDAPDRFRLVRVSNGETIGIAANVTSFSCVRDAGSDTVRISITLLSRGDRAEDLYVSLHTDEILLLNPKSA